MTAYVIVFRESPVHDPEAIAEYSRRNRENAAEFGKFGFVPLVAYGRMEALEGEAPDGIVLVQFPTMAEARAWYESPAYQDALPLRLSGAKWRAVLVEGLG